jgi:hypothetical protein
MSNTEVEALKISQGRGGVITPQDTNPKVNVEANRRNKKHCREIQAGQRAKKPSEGKKAKKSLKDQDTDKNGVHNPKPHY